MKQHILRWILRVGLLFTFCCRCHTQQVVFGDDEEDDDQSRNHIGEPTVFLTVSSLAAPNIPERLLEMNWRNIPREDDNNVSAIRLYGHEPHENIHDYLVTFSPNETEYYRTSIQFPRQNFTSDDLTNDCLGFWIAALHRDEIIASSCIRAYPTWMHDRRHLIGNVSLMGLMVPGTHNAGSYAQYDPEDDTIFKRYLITQDEDVWNQLIYGIRYLDLRISYENVDETPDQFWITHGVFRTEVSLNTVIEQVKNFLNSTREIVIMDFHRFVNGFKGKRAASRHQSLITLLENELMDYMIPVSLSSRVTLEELWQQNKRLYVGYASNSERLRSQHLFPAVRHLWGDKDNVGELFAYLNYSVCGIRQRRLTSAMAQLTPSTGGAIFDVYGGLRKMAQDVNIRLTSWFRDLWWQCSNIVSTDFFLGNNIIETAIKVNEKKYSYRNGNSNK